MDTNAFISTLVFNRARLSDATLGDVSLQNQLLAAFLRELPTTRAALQAGAALEEAALRDVLHKLRGSCHFAGADRLAEVLRAVGTCIASEAPAWREAVLHNILAELLSLERELTAHLAKAD